MGFGSLDYAPYAAPHGKQVDSAWKEWIGQWEGGWRLTEDGGPRLGFEDHTPMTLRPGAAYPVKGEFVFVVDGLEVAVRLWRSNGESMIELWQVEAQKLKRVDSNRTQ